VRLHASVSRRARFPALRELYSGALDRFEPNPSLRPERLLGAEVGATTARGALELQAVAFHHRLRDAVVRVTTDEGLFRRENSDEMRSTGLELLAAWTSGRLSLAGDLLVQRIRLRDEAADAGERRPEHQPELRGTLRLGAPLPLGARLLGEARYTGRQFCVHPDLGRDVELDGQGEGSVAVERSWSLSRGARGLLRTLRATLAIDNVTDATTFDQCGLPQPGRTLRLGVQVG
jgi:iron complex outermembrane receptor protein